MNFGLVQNGMLMAMAALAIPFIIHLMFRQKPSEVKIGSIRFLKQIMEQHRNRRRVMRWFLMALRMLGLILLALLFARPFLTENVLGKGKERFVSILVDRSASMHLMSDGTRLVDTAIEQAKEVIRSSDPDTEFAAAYFDHEVQPIGSKEGTVSAKQILDQLTAPEVSYAATDYAAAFRWAHDLCTNAKAAKKELHVFTDLQQSGLAWSEVEPMPSDVLVKVHDLGRELPNNVAITSASPTRVVVRPDESTKVEVSLLNAGPFPLDETPVVLEIKNGNRAIREKQKVKLEQGSIQTVTFDLPKLEQGLWQGKVLVELIDDLAFDNQRHVAILSAPQYRVLVVDGAPNEETEFLSETHFLQSALRLAPRGVVYSESPYLPELKAGGSISQFDIVAMANVKEIQGASAVRLQEFVREGGGLILFAGENVTREGYKSLETAGLMPGEIVASRESFDLPWRIKRWNESHSIFSVFNDPQNGDLRKLAFRGITEMRPTSDDNVLASFGDGKPFVLEQRYGDKDGTVLWVSTSCGNEWSTWTQSELYVPLIHQMMGHVTGLNAGGPVRERLIDTTDAETLVSRSPGVFQNNKSWQVVNVSPRESETERCSVDDFVSRFELNIGDVEEPIKVTRAGRLGTAMDVRENEFWHWILFALVIVCIAEFSVGNRTAA